MSTCEASVREVKRSSTECNKGQKLSRVILNLGIYIPEVICNWFTEDAYLPHVSHTVFGFAH